jgi:flagellar hook-associated protein 1 FlgK
MSISGALSIATSGLSVISGDLALISQNVANANAPDYAAEVSAQTALTADGVGLGVQAAPATRQVDTVLQAEALHQNATVASLQTRQSALQAIDTAQGTPGQASDLPSLLGTLQSAFSSLLNSPDNQTQQSAVVSAASELAGGINSLSNAYTTQRQGAQDNIVSAVNTLNSSLSTVGSLTDQIISLRASGQSTADLENQRDSALQTVSQLVDVKVLNQPDGDLVLSTAGGTVLPIHGTSPALSTTGAGVQSGAYYPGGGIPGITLDGTDVTNQLTGGQIGADITLRDTTLPTYQGELDEFAQSLASRFDAQGLRLFTDPAGAVPAGGGTPSQSGYVGFSATIQVNPAVQADPSLVRDGTSTIAGSTTGASAFTPNPSGGPAGFSTLIERVLNNTFGSQVQSGVDQPATATTGLGPAGTLNAPYTSPATLGDLATTMVAAQAQDSNTASSDLSTETAVQTSLTSKLSSQSGVSIDTEMANMIQLQNAYGANAKVITAVQSVWDQLLAMVQ